MAAAAIDVAYLAASYAVDDSTLQSLLSHPTVELAQDLLTRIQIRAREIEELRGEKLRSDVELETVVRDSNSRTKALKATVDKAVKDADHLRQKLAQEETARQQIDTELQTSKAAASTASSQAEALQSRVNSLESQKRDAIALVDSKSTAYDRLSEELAAQHNKYVTLRKDFSELEEKNQTLEHAATSIKFRETSLNQEIKRRKQDNEWYESELKTRSDEAAKYRKDKNAQISTLMQEKAETDQALEDLRRTDESQRQRIANLEHQADKTFVRIDQLQAEAARNQESARAEADSLKRLADLAQRMVQTKSDALAEATRVADADKNNFRLEVATLQAEIESECALRNNIEKKLEETELDLHKLETEVRESRRAPATPRRGFNSSLRTPVRPGSPIGSPSRARGASAGAGTDHLLEVTELRARNRALDADLQECRSSMEDMMRTLNDEGPLLAKALEDNERLMAEVGNMSNVLENAIRDREVARKETWKLQGNNKGLLREGELQRQQLRDLSAQIRVLLVEQQIREQGIETLTPGQKEYMRHVDRHELPPEQMDDATATGRLISAQLVLYRNVRALQEQNERALGAVRDIGEKLEGVDAQEKANQFERDQAEIARLREELATAQDETKSLHMRLEMLKRERDFYQDTLFRQGVVAEAPAATSTNGHSTDNDNFGVGAPSPANGLQGVQEASHLVSAAEHARVIQEWQNHSDSLKNENATVVAAYKQQCEQLGEEIHNLKGEVSRLSNLNDTHLQRQELLHAQLENEKKLKDTLLEQQKFAHGQVVKGDRQIQEIGDQLAEAKNLADGLSRENSNLKASQVFAEQIHNRAAADNNVLLEERNGLNKLVNDLRSGQVEQQQKFDDVRRRLESKVDGLEAELKLTNRKLDDEVKEHKQVADRREYDQNQSKQKIEDLTRAINDLRPELAAVTAQRDQLQTRVEELKAELRTAEDRALHARPTQRTNVAVEDEEDADREEELEDEIKSLKRDLQFAREDLTIAKENAGEFHKIARQAEIDMHDAVEAFDAANLELERERSDNDAKVEDLNKRIDEISTELATTTAELSELRSKHEEDSSRLASQRELHEATVLRLKDDVDREQAKSSALLEDLKAQADIANRAQGQYEEELVKHGEALRNLHAIRDEYTQLRAEVNGYKIEARTARASLEQSEEDWADLRGRYEHEIGEHLKRHGQLTEHSKLMHEEFENLSRKVKELQDGRASVAAGDVDTPRPGSADDGLREVIRYLRNEKDIMAVQLDLAIQDAKRSKEKLDYTTLQLDKAREQLEIEKGSNSWSKQTLKSTEALTRTIEELNVYRESAATLRYQNRQVQDMYSEKTKEFNQLYDKVEQLNLRIGDLEGQLETKTGEARMYEEDRERWQKRYENVLYKYDRIDPRKLDELNEKVATAEKERDEVRERITQFDARLEAEKEAAMKEASESFDKRLEIEKEAALKEANESFESRRATIHEHAKTSITKFKKERDEAVKERDGLVEHRDVLIKERDALVIERDALAKEGADLRQQLNSAQQELGTTKTARDDALAGLTEANSKLANSANPNPDAIVAEEGQVSEANLTLADGERQALVARAQTAEGNLFAETNARMQEAVKRQEVAERAGALEIQVGELQERIGSLNKELSEAQAQVKRADSHLESLQSQQPTTGATASVSNSEEVEKLKEELAAALKESEDLRTRADITETAFDPDAEVASTLPADKVITNAEADKRVEQTKEVWKAKADRMKEQFRTKMQENREKNEATIKQLNLDHAAELERTRQAASVSTVTAAPAGDPSTDTVKVEGLPTDPTTWNGKQVRDYVVQHAELKEIVRENVKKQLNNQKDSMAAKAKEEFDNSRKELEQSIAEKHAQELEQAKAKAKSDEARTHETKLKFLSAQKGKLKAQVDSVVTAVKETPEKPVKDVWEAAKNAKAPEQAAAAQASPKPLAGASQPTQVQPTATTPVASKPPAAVSNPPENPGVPTLPAAPNAQVQLANGAAANPFGQPSPAQLQQPNPFQSTGNANGQPQFGFGGPRGSGNMAQPNVPGAPTNANEAGPNPPFGQQQQQSGRGRGGLGPGVAALRDIQQQGQTGIPRGGGIPRATSRGGLQQNQQQPGGQNLGLSIQGAGNSQMGRGGRGRGGRGRGDGSGGPNSPRSNLNPGANQFNPGGDQGGRGQGQKRGPPADGDGEHGNVRGKRPRGGGN